MRISARDRSRCRNQGSSQAAQADLWAGLQIDAACAVRQIESFVRREVKRWGKRGVVIGLSGGLDSSTCAYLCVRALGAGRIYGLILPERDTDPQNVSHARLVAQRLGIHIVDKDITPLLSATGIYEPIPAEIAGSRHFLESSIRWIARLTGHASTFSWAMGIYCNQHPGLLGRMIRRCFWGVAGSILAFALTKPRVRMVMLYHAAAIHNALVVGTTDRSEWTIGVYEAHGDGAADIALLIHLYKTQIRELARYLGVPQEIINKPSSGDLAAGLPNESVIGLSYTQLDRVLYGLNYGIPEAEIMARARVTRRAIRDTQRAIAIANLRRSLPARLPDVDEMGKAGCLAPAMGAAFPRQNRKSGHLVLAREDSYSKRKRHTARPKNATV